ncbi:hypothetical protein H6G27_32185 [Nostoc linckia FACHB-104]|nr:hypothetical protein [Nostoc linckia FACHB-104]
MNKLFTLLTIFISLQLPAIAQQATAFKDKNYLQLHGIQFRKFRVWLFLCDYPRLNR